MAPSLDITEWLIRWSDGQEKAEHELIRLVLPEMRRLARRLLRRERANHTLQPTALVNEAYLKLLGSRTVRWRDRAHFYALTARIMRNVLVDDARRRLSSKRRGAVQCISFDDPMPCVVETPDELVALSGALDEFAQLDARKAKVIELRFFAGMSVEEVAEVLRVSPNTVIRDWSLARAWLLRKLSWDGNSGSDGHQVS